MKNSQWFGSIERLESRRLLSLGAIDTSFSGDGTQSYPFQGEQLVDNASSFDLASDGKVIVASTTKGRDEKSQILLARFNPDGEIDQSFGSDGEAITSLAGPVGPLHTVASASKVRVQSDGKILVAGQLGDGWAVFRFNANGSLDPSFDHNGIQTFDAIPGHVAVDLELLADGKILVGGRAQPQDYPSTHSNDFGVMRLNADGSIDRSFGDHGYVLSDLGYYDQLQQIAVDRAGNILAAGDSSLSEQFGFNSRIVLVRYRSDGALDTAFGKRGKLITPLRGGEVFSLQSLHNGRILLSGSNGNDAFLMRLDKRGTLDKTFGNRGIMSFDLGSNNDGAMVLRADRRGILVLGAWGKDYSSYPPTDRKQFLLHFRADGSTDVHSRREITLNMDGPQQLSGGARIVGDNQVLALFSTSINGEVGRLTFARFKESSAIDSTFGQGGQAMMTVKGPLNGTPVKVIAQPDGKIIVLADLWTADKNNLALLRMNPTGELDSSFGKGGRVDLKLNSYGVLTLDSKGRIVVAGPGSESDGELVQRFNADGSVDNSFGDHGLVTIADGADSPTQIVVLRNGKILVAGSRNYSVGAFNIEITQLNADGSLDENFAEKGTLSDSFDGMNFIDHLLPSADGKFTVVGNAEEYHDLAEPAPVRVFIARYNADGTADHSFSEDGRIITDDIRSTNAAKLTSDGGVLLLGQVGIGREFKVVRYKADGSAAGTTVREAPDRIVKAFFEADGRILILTRSSTVRLAADGSMIAGSQRGSAIGHGSDEVNGEIYSGALAITPDHKLLLAGHDANGDLTLWRYLLD